MFILTDLQIQDNLACLDTAWTDAPTFALVPDKSPASREWIDRALPQIPEMFQTRCFALLTSGSTGQPRLVIGARERAEQLVEVLHEQQDSVPVRETIVTLPLTYSYAFVNQWVWSRHLKRRLVPTPGFGDPDALKAALERAHDAMLCLVGVQVPLLMRYFGTLSFPGVVRVHFAGGPFPQERLHQVRRLFPSASVFNNYGCAEAMPRLTLRRAEEGEESRDIGRPLPGVELKTADSGALLFRSPYRALGVVDGGGFVAITPEEWVPTGDLGRRTDRGAWELAGRTQEVFKRHGEKISLSNLMRTVETTWPGHAAFYRESDATGEEGHVLLLAPTPSAEQVRTILVELRRHYPRAHWPLRLESLDALPVLPNGKVDLRTIATIRDKTIHWYQRI